MTTSSAFIKVEGLCKSFGGQVLYQDFDLSLPRGKVISIFGPNGCGKSTLINMMSGLIPIDRGQITIAGKPLRRSRIGYVFQNYRDTLFPWISALDNISYPLKVQGISEKERQVRVEKLLATFDIKLDLRRYPYQFSGGQQQLIAILRAVVADPEVLFLDEPFSALDFEMTLYIREKLQQVHMESDLTTVIVSHDLEDAVYLADSILLLSKRPTHLVENVVFNLPRPRTPETLSEPEFVQVKSHCLDIFRQEMRK
ncbi:ABC transporter ATP-binding protein [Leptolyngbya sp. AN03gr2]|uniref:ABC transporter ATP-binding protein n=1 Tax=unclassified Leptolyngbya TaxID=2650499 RepID=UPI003D314D91